MFWGGMVISVGIHMEISQNYKVRYYLIEIIDKEEVNVRSNCVLVN